MLSASGDCREGGFPGEGIETGTSLLSAAFMIVVKAVSPVRGLRLTGTPSVRSRGGREGGFPGEGIETLATSAQYCAERGREGGFPGEGIET